MSDMRSTIVPKSDQLNSDDLLSGPITITITSVDVKSGQEQPVSVHYQGDSGKPYKPCKSMCRVMVSAWGADASKYVGRSLTLYSDPKVRWAGLEVGGIRISHMSHIDSAITMALTVTRANKKPFTVRPIGAAGGTKSEATPPRGSQVETTDAWAASDLITAEEAMKLDARCTDNGIDVVILKRKANVNALHQIKSEDLEKVHRWIDVVLENRRKKTSADPATVTAAQ